MGAVEQLLKLNYADLTPKTKEKKYEIDRLTNKLKASGINEKFEITIQTVDADSCFDARSIMYDFDGGKPKLNKNEYVDACLDLCRKGIVDPKYNDESLLAWLGIKKVVDSGMTWKKIFTKAEIVQIGMEILVFSESNIDAEEEVTKRKETIEKVKN